MRDGPSPAAEEPTLRSELGLPPAPRVLAEKGADGVDIERLERYHLSELAPSECEEVRRMIIRYRNWSTASVQVLLALVRESRLALHDVADEDEGLE